MMTEPKIANVGIRPSRHGLEMHGLRNLNVRVLELSVPHSLWNMPSSGVKATWPVADRWWCGPASLPGALPKTNSSCATRPPTPHVQWGAVNQPMSEAHFDRIYSKHDGLLAGPRRLRAGLLRGRRPALHAARARDQPVGLAHPLRAAALHPARPAADRRSQARVHHSVRARFPDQPGRGRHQLGDLHRHQLQAARWC